MALERQLATEEEFNNYTIDKMSIAETEEESISFFEDFIQKQELKRGGVKLTFYKDENKVYYAIEGKVIG